VKGAAASFWFRQDLGRFGAPPCVQPMKPWSGQAVKRLTAQKLNL
jgi:hypothetical protein